MGGIGRVLSFLRAVRNGAQVSDVTIDPGGGANVTSEHFSDSGDDASPLPTDYAVYVSIPRQGGQVVVGYIDPINVPKSAPGDKRIRGRDKDTGADVCDVWLKNDGSIKAANALGYYELRADGVFEVNGVTIGTDGTITTPTGVVTPSAVVNGKEIAEHDHAIVSGSSQPGPTGPNN